MLKLISKIFIALLILTIPVNVAAQNHWALQARNLGPSKILRGKVSMMVVYVSTPRYRWSDYEIKSTFNPIWEAAYAMEREARRYGVNLVMNGWKYYTVSIPMECNSNDLTWYWYLMHNFFRVQNMQDYHNALRRMENANDTPVIFMLKRPKEPGNVIGRTHLVTSYAGNWNEEFSFIFCGEGFKGGYLFHELMHQYGAMDFYDYNNEGVQAVARKIFGRTCMIDNEYIVDSLTAYLIGWLNYLPKDAQAFLHYTENKR